MDKNKSRNFLSTDSSEEDCGGALAEGNGDDAVLLVVLVSDLEEWLLLLGVETCNQ